MAVGNDKVVNSLEEEDMKGRKPSFLNIASYFIFYFSILLIIPASLLTFREINSVTES